MNKQLKQGDVVGYAYCIFGFPLFYREYHIETYPHDYVIAIWRIKKINC